MTPELDVNKIYNTFISFVVDPTIPPEIGLEQILEMFPELVEVLGGDPVNLLTGSFDWEYTDTALYGEYDLEFIRHYQSARAHKNTGLGYGWSHNFNVALDVSGMTARITLPSGNEIYFERGSDGGFYGAPGSAFTFEWDGNSYQLINRDGTV